MEFRDQHFWSNNVNIDAKNSPPPPAVALVVLHATTRGVGSFELDEMWSCTSCQDTSSVILRNVRAKTLKLGRRCLNLHENTSRETGIKYVRQLYSAGPDTAYRYSVFLAGLNLSQIWAPFGQREQVLGLDTCWCWFRVGSTYDPVCFC